MMAAHALHAGRRGIAMGLTYIFHDGLIPFLAVLVATTFVALACHYFTSGWPSLLESLFWDFVVTVAACLAFIAIPLWHLSGAALLPWSGEWEPVEIYRALVELSCLAALIGYILGAVLIPVACKRAGCWQ